MPELIIWKNREIDKLRRDMDRLFNRVWFEFCTPPAIRISRGIPYIDLSETEDSIIVKAELPGVEPEDLDISITDDVLHIRGEIKQEITRDSESFHRTERTYGSFARSVQLPCRVEVDEVEASHREGVLRIIMPKCKPEKARSVKIRLK